MSKLDNAASAHEDLLRSKGDGIHIFGAGGFARSVASSAESLGIKVHAFLVSGDPTQKVLDGIPVHRVDSAMLMQRPTWIGVFNREKHSDYSALQAQFRSLINESRLIWPQVFYQWLEESLGWRFWLHTLDGYGAVAPEIDDARGFLEDQDSRENFDRLISFRRMADDNWNSPQPSADPQYLPPWLVAELVDPLRIVDGGAYRGETLRELSLMVPVERAWTFEPDPENYSALVQNLSEWNGPLVHIPAGLSDRSGMAGFSSGNGEGCTFASGGASQVAIVALDDCLHRAPINFLKLDVEGNEIAALHGARVTLLRERPILAVAGYHRWDDLWRIPAYIAGLGLNYRLRLGLHGHNSFDCVFYAY